MALRPNNIETLVASAARTTSGNTGELTAPVPTIDQPPAAGKIANRIRAQLDVTAASGTSPTLNVVVEDTLDGTNWNAVGAFTQRTAAGREVLDITGLFAPRLRVRWALAGTSPSFTFSVVAVGSVA